VLVVLTVGGFLCVCNWPVSQSWSFGHDVLQILLLSMTQGNCPAKLNLLKIVDGKVRQLSVIDRDIPEVRDKRGIGSVLLKMSVDCRYRCLCIDQSARR